ncbi:MAG: vWA domain-containing protein, partial [Candidatus Hydrogenedens sp.]
SRNGLSSGEYKDVGLQFRVSGKTQVVTVSMEVSSALSVTPQVFTIRPDVTETTVTVQNVGTESFNWSVKYVPDLNNSSVRTNIPADISVSPNLGTLPAGGSTPVTVRWDETVSTDFGLFFESSLGIQLVEFRFAKICPETSFTAEPAQLVLSVTKESLTSDSTTTNLPVSKLTLTNSSSTQAQWNLQVVGPTGIAINSISATPSAGIVNPNDKVEISVTVTKPKEITLGAGQYSIIIDTRSCLLIIPIKIEQISLPEIAISEPPQETTARPEIIPLDVLDFGQEDVQKEFWIANVGPRDSKLYFRITHEDEGKANPVIADVRPVVGGANGEDGNPEDFYHPSELNLLIDGVQILVTINRDNLQEDIEYRTITIEAMDHNPIIFPNEATPLNGVESKTIKVRVEKQPLRIEGALNRSRPPYVMRYVFLLRDSSSRAIPTITPVDRSKISLTISEDSVPLDLRETNYFLTGPENIKGNMIILLDYTGSMYYAGVDNKDNPMLPGEAIEKVKKAVVDFIYDLPASYQIALMFHNDRQQTRRLIRSFTTDKELLKESLETFYVPPNLMGASDIYDALSEAVDRLIAEDLKNPLPFDDADVKSIIFISDGWDNASTIDASEIKEKAHDNLIRLYPLGFASGGSVNTADLIPLAKETGGHLYIANDVNGLLQLLGGQKSCVLRPDMNNQPNDLTFFIYNEGKDNLGWQADTRNLPAWITNIEPVQGTISASGSTKVTIRTNPALATTGVVLNQQISITSNDGNGIIKLQGVTTAGAWENITLALEDSAGRVWEELKNQLVLTYITPKQQDFKYTIRFEYQPGNNLPSLTGIFEEDAFAYIGDVRAGQLSLVTSGLFYGNDPNNSTQRTWQAEVFVRADYIPRDVYFLRTRYFLQKPNNVTAEQWNLLLANINMKVELAGDGLITTNDGWRFINEGDGVYLLLNSEDKAFKYGAFGNLFKITITGLDAYVQSFGDTDPVLNLAMRVDNESLVYIGSIGQSSRTKYFLYPGGPTYIDGFLPITISAKVAGPSTTIAGLAGLTFDPESTGAWDNDKDGITDFQDPAPNDKNIPGKFIVPTRLDIPVGNNSITFIVHNNRLDTFNWQITSYPSWVTDIKYGLSGNSNTPDSELSPGETETVTLFIDRTGLIPGTMTSGNVIINTDIFASEKIDITVAN